MATFSALQARVIAELIDVPSGVTTYAPTWVNAALFFLQAQHSFQVQEAEAQFVTASTPALGASQTHVFGYLPADWKAKRGMPYFTRYIGSTRLMTWQAERQMMYRTWNPSDVNQIGEPSDLLIGEPENTQVPPSGGSPANLMTGLTLECYPFPDGSSDWSDGNYRINVPYSRYLPALVAGGDQSWFTLDGPQAEFAVRYAVAQGFFFNEDEQRASLHLAMAVGKGYDGSRAVTLGGWARTVIDMDKGIKAQPARQLAMRRDVYARRDQWRQ